MRSSSWIEYRRLRHGQERTLGQCAVDGLPFGKGNFLKSSTDMNSASAPARFRPPCNGLAQSIIHFKNTGAVTEPLQTSTVCARYQHLGNIQKLRGGDVPKHDACARQVMNTAH